MVVAVQLVLPVKTDNLQKQIEPVRVTKRQGIGSGEF